MKKCLGLIFCIVPFLSFSQIGNRDSLSGGWGGMVYEKVNESVASKITVIYTGKCKIVGFPDEYSKKRDLIDPNEADSFFTPDDELSLISEIKKQYCEAKRYRAITSCKNMIKLCGKDLGKKFIKEQESRRNRQLEYINANCTQLMNGLDSIDKQVIGFYSHTLKGKILLIQLCDFRNDPYKLKGLASRQWIDGWHGWFESNLERLYYNIDQNKLSVHGDDF